MSTVIESLLADHKMIRRLLDGLNLENPRFEQVSNTLDRVVQAHAGFEDDIVAPVAKETPPLQPVLTDEILREHSDIATLLKLVRSTGMDRREDLEIAIRQLKAVLNSHFSKEEDAWFPLIEKYAPAEKLAKTKSSPAQESVS